MKKAKRHYSWWPYIKEIVRQYPERECKILSGVPSYEKDAVAHAISLTERIESGDERIKVIEMVHWDKTHTLEGAALEIPCSRRTAAYWQREFFEEVARNRGLLD